MEKHSQPTLREVTLKLILERLAQFQGSKPAAAKSLGVSTKTVYNWTRHLGR